MNEKTTEVKQTIPPWLTYILGVLLSAAIAIIGSKWGVTPQPIPAIQFVPFTESQSRVIYVQAGGGCQCATIEKK